MYDFILPSFTRYINDNDRKHKEMKMINYYYNRLLEMYEEDDKKLEETMYLQTGVHTLQYILKHNNSSK